MVIHAPTANRLWRTLGRRFERYFWLLLLLAEGPTYKLDSLILVDGQANSAKGSDIQLKRLNHRSRVIRYSDCPIKISGTRRAVRCPIQSESRETERRLVIQ